jgi:hypothetical protein
MFIVKSIYNFLQDMGRIRAASYLARRGEHAAAQKLMSSDFKGWV